MSEDISIQDSPTQPVLLRSRVISPQERLQALLQAAANEERAAMCGPAQIALRKFYMANAELLLKFSSIPGDQ